MSIFIEPTTRCNLQCRGCLRGPDLSIPNADMDISTFETILERIKLLKIELAKRNIPVSAKKLSYFWRGEPSLHLQLPELMAKGKEYGYFTYTSLNGTHLLDLEYTKRLVLAADKIEFCLDGSDEETINKYRLGTKWKNILTSLENIAQSADLPDAAQIEMRVLMFKWNDQAYAAGFFHNIAREYKFSSVSYAAPVIDGRVVLSPEIAEQKLSQYKQFQRYYLAVDGLYHHRSFPGCNINPLNQLMIGVDGTLYPCCYDRAGQYRFANLIYNDLEQIIDRGLEMKHRMAERDLEPCHKYCFIPDPDFKIDHRYFLKGGQN